MKASILTCSNRGYLQIRCTGLMSKGANSEIGSSTWDNFCANFASAEFESRKRRQLTESDAFSAIAKSWAAVRLAQ